MTRRIASYVGLILLSTDAAVAELRVIYDNGQTHDLPAHKAAIQQTPTMPSLPSGYDFSRLFPVHTPTLQPGRAVAAHSAELLETLRRLPGPLFLIGSDTLSLRWLAAQREHLIARKAIGFLVEADSLADYQRVLDIAGQELVIVPSSAERLAEVLGLQYYPVLLTRDGLQP